MPAPSDASGSPPDDPNRSEAVCGTKFRAMLLCVERTGAVAACTDKVNDFLACERRVFHKAMRKATQQPMPPAAPLTPPACPPQPSQPQQQQHTAREKAPEGDVEERGPTTLFAQPWQSLQRVVKKQAAACASLAQVVGRPAFPAQLMQFNRRMVADMKVTCDIIRTKAGQFVNNIIRSPSEDDGKS